MEKTPTYYICTHCHRTTLGSADAPPQGWSVSYFKDCQSPLHYCPDCAQTEAEAVARNKAAWTDPAANRAHASYDEWLAAMAPLAREVGYIGREEGPEGLREIGTDLEWPERCATGETPAAAMREDLSNVC